MSREPPLEKQFLSFESFATHYDSIRPDYPAALATDIRHYCGLTPRSRILEIGTGTGKATGLFTRHGFNLTGIEPSAAMAATARSNLAGNTGVDILETTFEDIEFPAGTFDLIFAAQSFHWVDTAAGFRKAHQLLNENGMLAVFWNLKRPLPPHLQRVFDEIYRRHFRREPWFCMDEDCLDRSDRQRRDRIEASGLFSVAVKRVYEWSHKYTGTEYVRLLDSYTDHRRLPDYDKRGLYAGIATAIDRHGGVLDLPYVTFAYLCTRC